MQVASLAEAVLVAIVQVFLYKRKVIIILLCNHTGMCLQVQRIIIVCTRLTCVMDYLLICQVPGIVPGEMGLSLGSPLMLSDL